MRTLGVSDKKVDPGEISEVLSTYRRLYQRTQAQAEKAMADIGLPELGGSGGGLSSERVSALDWAERD